MAAGDQRINSFGIGGEIEIRSGLLTQKQIIDSPVLHFGLGDRKQTDVARIVWPNGSVQAEFELKPDPSILAIQRLKGSCPMLFAWDGKQIELCEGWRSLVARARAAHQRAGRRGNSPDRGMVQGAGREAGRRAMASTICA